MPPIAEDLGRVVTGPKTANTIRKQVKAHAAKNAAMEKQQANTPIRKESPGSANPAESAEVKKIRNTPEWERANGTDSVAAQPTPSSVLRQLGNSPGWDNAAKNSQHESPRKEAKVNSPRANAQLVMLVEKVKILQTEKQATAKKYAMERKAMEKVLLERTAAANAAVTQSSSKAAIDLAKEAKRVEKVKLFYFS